MKSVFFIFIFSVCIYSLSAQNLLDDKTRDLFHEALSGELAKEHVIQITRHHRIQGSRGYRDAAKYVLGKLREYGFSENDAYIESFVSDGKKEYQTWQSPSGWDITSAELRMVEPYDERIVGYPEIAMSVITYSNAGDATAELVDVGNGTSDKDYEGKDVRGKFVLATGYGGAVHRLAVLKYGAKAVVCFLDDERAKEYPDMLQYTGMWPRSNELTTTTFGFNLTNRQGKKLKELLASGKKVVLHGKVEGVGLEPYYMDVVVAKIFGSEHPEEELVFSAHLDHPKESANDNASGSGAILDIARTLNELISSGRLPKPKRTFRFIWVPEWNGTMAYIDGHPEFEGPELGGNWLANMNMDMVGENLELLHSQLILTRTPSSLPSCVNDVVTNMAEMVDGIDVRTPRGSLSAFNYRVTPYGGGSDHMMFIDRKIPGIMFSHSDYTHHTSEDTPDKVDPVELERCEIIATSTLWYLANLDDSQAKNLSYHVQARALGRLGDGAKKGLQLLAGRDTVTGLGDEAQNILKQSLANEIDGLISILNFNNSVDVKQDVATIQSALKYQYEFLAKEIADKVKGTNAGISLKEKRDTRIPVRMTRGPLDFGLPANTLDAEKAKWYSSSENTIRGDMEFEIVNFINGKKTISEIRDALSAEFTPVKVEAVAHYIEDLVSVGVVKWK
ncbi:MAG: M28 family peptidase [Ignavibacteriae bacterium]|nr:M28 family peptidase [Ignavibacteriota bacterium]